jgi:hypothetical protein
MIIETRWRQIFDVADESHLSWKGNKKGKQVEIN